MDQKHLREEKENTQEDALQAGQWELSGAGANEVAAVARREFEGLFKS